MSQPPVTLSASDHIPLGAQERERAEVNFIPYVIQALVDGGRFQVTADTLEMVEVFQRVAHRVGNVLQRPVVIYANGEEVVITFDPQEPPGLTGQGAISSGG
ncbi:MAG: hypothetical protein ACRDRL_12855 [Sciscionella sp.]